MATTPRTAYISLLGAIFDRLQLQAAAELTARLNEVAPPSAREKGKRAPILQKQSEQLDVASIFAGFPRRCNFYDQILIALLSTNSTVTVLIG